MFFDHSILIVILVVGTPNNRQQLETEDSDVSEVSSITERTVSARDNPATINNTSVLSSGDRNSYEFISLNVELLVISLFYFTGIASIDYSLLAKEIIKQQQALLQESSGVNLAKAPVVQPSVERSAGRIEDPIDPSLQTSQTSPHQTAMPSIPGSSQPPCYVNGMPQMQPFVPYYHNYFPGQSNHFPVFPSQSAQQAQQQQLTGSKNTYIFFSGFGNSN